MALRRSEERGDEAGLTRAQTLDFCARLAQYSEAGPTPRDLLLRAGTEATRQFGDDGEVLVAVGRMYLMGEELPEAERALRRAVRQAPEDPHAFRHLGEVLLRQGDPMAAHAALSRAVACGMNDPWTKTWVARALDYSEMFDDLGREGIARDVRQVLGKPGIGPPDDERRRDAFAKEGSSHPGKRDSRTQVLGRIDKGVFFAGDTRAEPVESRRSAKKWGVGDDDVVDLPTPAPAGVDAHVHDSSGQRAVVASGQRPAIGPGQRPAIGPGQRPAIGPGQRPATGPTQRPAIASGQRLAMGPAQRPPIGLEQSSPAASVRTHVTSAAGLAAALADDAAWGRDPGAPPSESIPPSDTEISAWEPEAESAARVRRSAPPVRLSPSDPPARQSYPEAQRQSYPDAQRQSYPEPARQSRPEPALRSAPPRVPRSAEPPPADPRAPVTRVAPPPPALPRISAAELFDEFTENRRAITLLTGSDRPPPAASGPRRGPPPLPPEPSPDHEQARSRATPVPSAHDQTLASGSRTTPPNPQRPFRALAAAPVRLVVASDADEGGPVTAPPSALIPLAPSTRRGALPTRDTGPATAPPSALLPPEPPSLQVPSRVLLGGSIEPPSSTRSSAPGRQSAPTPVPAPPTRPRSRVQTILLRGLIALVFAGLVAGGLQLWRRNRLTKIRTFSAQAAAALHVGGPRGVADAEAALASARHIDPKSRTVALGTLRTRFFAVLDVDPARLPELVTAMTDATALGLRSSDMAFAEVIRAVASNDSASATELIAHHDEDAERASDALYQLAAGAALEPQDTQAAIERYGAAVKLDADLLTAEIRLARALAFSGRAPEARTRLSALIQKWPDRPELTALAALIAAADPSTATASTSLDPGTDVDMLPRSLRAVARALAKSDDDVAVAKAASEADIAQVVVLCGEIALRSGHEASARDAAQRALEISSSYPPAYALVARVGLAAGRFEESRQAALRAPPDVAGEVLALIAYEAGDLSGMLTAAGRRADDPPRDPVAAGVARLRGASPLSTSTISALAKSPLFWAEVVAMDAALDAGELDLAQSIAATWVGADKHPVRSVRVARLLRYQGKNGAAQIAAASAAPTLVARVEMALAAAEMASTRDAAVAALQGGRSPEEHWALSFLLAREGKDAAARQILRTTPLPESDAPLLTRTIAALALNELHIRNPSAALYPSLDVWTRNPDVARALGNSRPSASPAPAAQAAPGTPREPTPAKPPPQGRLPQKDDGDPY